MYIKDGIKYRRRDDLEWECLESSWIKIFINKSKNFLMTSFYRPPNDSKYLAKDFDEQFNDQLMMASREKKEVIILGDLNSDYLVKNDNVNMKNAITINEFNQLIDKPTRVSKNSKSCIDIIATNKGNISKVDVNPVSLSDHDMIIYVRKLNHMKYNTRYVTSRNYSWYDPVNLQRDLKNTDFSTIINCNDINETTEPFTSILTTVFDKHAPIFKKRQKGKPTPWLDINVRRDMDQQDKVLWKARKSKSDNNWILYKRLRNFCNNRLKTACKNYYHNMLNENRLNPRNFRRTIKSIFPTKAKNCKSQCSAKSFGHYFELAVLKLRKTLYVLADLVWRVPKFYSLRINTTFKFQYISVFFVHKELKNLHRNKTAGIDNLPPGLLKDYASEICRPLAHIINLSMSTSTVPTHWKGDPCLSVWQPNGGEQLPTYLCSPPYCRKYSKR